MTKLFKYQFLGCLILVFLFSLKVQAASINGLSQVFLENDASQMFTVAPANGTFVKGKGIIYTNGSNAEYSPVQAGIGIDSVIYEKNGNTDTVVVKVLPVVHFDANRTLCEGSGSFSITDGTPVSPGTWYYSGNGISGTNTFDPAAAGTGVHEIVFFYQENSVVNSDTAYYTVKNAPDSYNLTGSGIYCAGDNGRTVSLSNSETGVSYQLRKNGSTYGPVIFGSNGSSLTWNNNTYGSYTVYATDTATACGTLMNHSVLVTEAALPATFGIIEDTAYCAGSSGITLEMDGSELSVSYQLIKDGINEGPATGGDGDTLSWSGLSHGTYKIRAENDTSACAVTMSDSLTVNEKPLPLAYTFSGPSGYCAGAGGVTLTLSGSQTGIHYYLYKDGVSAGYKSGTGAALSWSSKLEGNYYVQAVNPATGCVKTMTGSVSVTEYALPTADAGSDAAICSGSSTVLSASGGISYAWSPGLSLSDSTDASPTSTPSQTETYTVTVTDAKGCRDIDDVTVTVRSLPNVNAGSDKTMCIADTITLTVTGGDTYLWSTGGTSSSIRVSPTTNTSYYVTVTGSNGCSNEDTVKVTVKNRPTANAGSDTTICRGTSAKLKASGGVTYLWSNGDNTQNITVTPNSTTNYKVTVTNASGCSDVDDVQVRVVDNPVVANSGDEVICASDTIFIAASATGGKSPYDYSWNTGEGTAVINVSPMVETNYKVVVRDDNLCRDSAIVNVDVNPLPVVDISGLADVYCKDHGPVTFQGNPTSGTGDFFPDSILNDLGTGYAEFDPSSRHPGTTYAIYYQYMDGNGCVSSDTFRVEVSNDNTPNPSILNLQSMYCDNDTATYLIQGSPAPLAGESGVFNEVSLAGVTDNHDGTANLKPGLFAIGNYQLNYNFTNASGCVGSTSESFDVGVPISLNIQAGYCESVDSFQLTVTKPAGTPDGKFWIYKGSSLIYTAGEGTPEAVFDPSSQGPGFYSVRYEVSNGSGSCSNSDSLGFEVYSLPDPAFTLNGISHSTADIAFCNNEDTVTLKGVVSGGTYYGTGVIGNKFIPKSTTPGDYQVKHVITDANGCMGSDSTGVSVKSLPGIAIDTLKPSYCNDVDSFTILGNPSNGVWVDPWNADSVFMDKGDGSALFTPKHVGAETDYTISYKVTGANGCIDSLSQVVRINFIPDVDFTGLPASYCRTGDTLVLNGTPQNSNGAFSGPGITDLGNGLAVFDPSGLSAGEYHIGYDYVDPLTGCASRKQKTIRILNDPKQFALNASASFCEGDSAAIKMLDSENGLQYKLMRNGVTTVKSLTGTGGELSFGYQKVDGTYTVKASNASCSLMMDDSMTITVHENPVKYQVLGDTGYCPGSGGVSIELSDSENGIRYMLKKNGNNEDTLAGSSGPLSWNNRESGTYEVLAENILTGCDAYMNGSISVNAFPVPQAEAGEDTFMCVSHPVRLQASGGVAYRWQPGTGLSDSTRADPLAGPSNSTSYVVSVKDENNCTGTDTITLEVYPNPIANAGLDTTICQGEDMLLSANGGIYYKWSTGQTSRDITVSPRTGKSYHVTVTDGNQCSDRDTVNVSVKNAPVANAGSDETICSGDTVMLKASGGGSYLWSTGDTAASITVSPMVSTVYSVTVTNSNQCSAVDSVEVTVLDNPAVSLQDYVICPSDTQQIAASATGGTGSYSYSWSTGEMGNQITVSPPDQTTYQVRVADGNGCRATATSEVTLYPAALANAGNDTSICEGENVSLTATGGVSYEWNTGDLTATITKRPLNDSRYRVTVTDANGCKARDEVAVTVRPVPVANAGSNDTLCRGDAVTLKASGGETYLWSTGETQSAIQVSPDVTSDYNVTITGTNGCKDSDSVRVVVLENPSISLPDYAVCAGKEVTLQPVVSGGNGSIAYDWSTGSHHGAVTVTPDKDSVYYLSVTDKAACQAKDSSRVSVKPLPEISLSGLNPAYCNDTNEVELKGTPVNGYFTDPWNDADVFEDEGNGTALLHPASIDVEGAYTFYYTAYGSNGCKDSIANTVTIHAIPDVTFSGLPGSACPYDKAYALTGNPVSSFGRFKGGGISDNGNGTASFNAAGLSRGNHTVTYHYTEPSTGCHNADTQSVEVYHLPGTAYAITGSGTYCEGSKGKTLGLSGSDDQASYELYLNHTTKIRDTILSNGNQPFDFNGTYREGTYTVKALTSNQCVAFIRDTVVISKSYPPGDARAVSGDTLIDLNSLASFSVPSIPYVTPGNYKWKLPSMASVISGAGTKEIQVSFNGVVAGTYTLSVYGENGCGKGKASELRIHVKNIPDPAGPLSGPANVCQQDKNLQYHVPAIGDADSVQWEVPGGFSVVSGRTDTMITVNIGDQAVSGNIVVYGVNSSGDGLADTLYVTVSNIPDISLQSPANLDCSGDPVALIGASSTAGASFKWDVGNGHFIHDDTALVSNTGEYEFTVTAGGCSASGRVTVRENISRPDLLVPVPDTITCRDSLVTLPAMTSISNPSFRWEAYNGGNIKSGASASSAIVNKSGKYRVRLTDLSNACYHDTSVWVEENKSKPVIDVAFPQALTCSRTSVQLQATQLENTDYLWEGPGIQTRPDLSSTEVNMAGTYNLTASNVLNGCQTVKTLTVDSSYTKPSGVQAMVEEALSCTNHHVELIGSSNTQHAGYHWKALNDGVVTNAANDTAIASEADYYALEVTHPLTGCSRHDTVEVAENLYNPEVSIVVDQKTIGCNQSLELSASSGVSAASFFWSTSNGHIVSGRLRPDLVVDSAGTYTVRVTDTTNGCYGEASVKIAADYSPPVVKIDDYQNPILTCSNKSVSLKAKASEYASLQWTGPGVIDGAATLQPTVYEAGKYTLKATGTNGCESTGFIKVRVDTTKPNMILVSDYPDITCKNMENTLSVQSITPDVTYHWQVVQGTGTIDNPDSQHPVVREAGLYSVTVKAGNGCVQRDTVHIDTNYTRPVIVNFNPAPDSISCKNTWVTLEGGTSTPGAGLKWTTDGTGQIQNAITSTPRVNAGGTYTLTVTHPETGCLAQQAVRVNTNFILPVPDVDQAVPRYTCTRQSIQLDGFASEGINYQWTAGKGGNITSDPSLPKPYVNAPGWYTLTVQHASSGCRASDSVEVKADNSVPVIIPGYMDHKALTCQVEQITLSIDSVSTPIYWWSTGDSSLSIQVNTPGTYTFYAEHPHSSCTNNYSFHVASNTEKPVVRINEPQELTCDKRKETLLAFTEKANNLQKVSYTWTPGAGGNIQSGAGSSGPVVTAPAAYYLQVRDDVNGCISRDTVTVTENIRKPGINLDDNPAILSCTNSLVYLEENFNQENVRYQWTTTSGGHIYNAHTPTPGVDGEGYYTLTLRDEGNGCSIKDSVYVKADYETPDLYIDTLSLQEISCKVQQVELKGSAPGYGDEQVNYQWTGPGTMSAAGAASTYVDAPGTYYFKVTLKRTGCDTSAYVRVTENTSKPAPPVVPDKGNCYGAAVSTLSASGGHDVKWYTHPGLDKTSLVHSGASFTPNVTAAGKYEYYVTQTGADNGCESPPTGVVYSVHPLPGKPVLNDQGICYGMENPALHALADRGHAIRWYNDTEDSLLAAGASYLPPEKDPGHYLYQVTQVDSHGCESPSGTAGFTIHHLPGQAVVIEDSLSACSGNPLPSFSAQGDVVKWYSDFPVTEEIHRGNVFRPLVTHEGTYTYYVTNTHSSTGCEGPHKAVHLTIKPGPAPYSLTGGGTHCEGTLGKEIGLAGSDDPGMNTQYKLILDEHSTLAVKQGTGKAMDFGYQTREGLYRVRAVGANGCSALMEGTAFVTRNPLPGIPGEVKGPAKVCQGQDFVSYEIESIANATSYQWNIPEGFTYLTGEASRFVTLHVSDSAVNGIVSVQGVNACGSGPASAGLQVRVDPKPGQAGFITGPDVLCQGEKGVVYETPSITNANVYVWDLPSGFEIVSGEGTRTIIVNVSEHAAGGNLSVHGQNKCTHGTPSESLEVHVKQAPPIQKTIAQSVCAEQTQLKVKDPGSASIAWDVIQGPGVVADQAAFETEIRGLGKGKNLVRIHMQQSGCDSYDTVTIVNNQLNVNAGDDKTICGGQIMLDATVLPAGCTGYWSVENGNAGFEDGSASQTRAGNFARGDNSLRWTIIQNGCESHDEIIIRNDQPSQADAGIEQNICYPETELSATVPRTGTGRWSVLYGSVEFEDYTNPMTGIVRVSQGENRLLWTVRNNSCVLTDTVVIRNNQLDVHAGEDQIVCSPITTLNATKPAKGKGSWSLLKGSALFVNRYDASTEVSGLIADTNYLRWTVHYQNCISEDDVIIINHAPSDADAGDMQIIEEDHTFMAAEKPEKGTGEWTLLSGSASIADPYLYNTEVTNLNHGDNVFQWKVSYQHCMSIDTVSIRNNAPTFINAGEDQIICATSTVLNATKSQLGIGEWSVVKGSAKFEDNREHNTRVYDLGYGVNILRWKVFENGTTYDDVKIVNNLPSTPVAGSDQAFCHDNALLTANQPLIGEGKWEIIGGSAEFADSSSPQTEVYNLGYGANTLRWSIRNKGCVLSDEIVLTNNLPTPANAGEDKTICADKSVLNGNNPEIGEGRWTIASGSSSASFKQPEQGNTEVTNLGKGPNTLRWTINHKNCRSYDEVVIINDLPTDAYAGADQSICSDTLTLAANNPVVGVGEWSILSGSANFENIRKAGTEIENIAYGNNIFRWTVTHNGCVSYDEVEVSYDLIDADAGLDQRLCQDHTILKANNPGKGAGYWSVVAGSGSAVFEHPNEAVTKVNSLERGKNILRWTVSYKNCISYDDVLVENNLPSEPLAGGDQIICRGETKLEANEPLVGKGTWSLLSGSAAISDKDNPLVEVFDLARGPNTFRWTIKNKECILSDEVIVNNNLPVDARAGEDKVVCEDSTVLYGNDPPYGSGQWTVVAGAASFRDAGEYDTRVYGLGRGANTLRWTISNEQCQTSDEITIVNDKANVAIAGADQVLCDDKTILSANPPGTHTGYWEIVSGSGKFENTNNHLTEVSNLSYGTNILRWVINHNSCSSSDEIKIINNLPSPANAGVNIHVCGDRTRLFAENPEIGTGSWSVVSGNAEFNDDSVHNTMVRNLGFGANTLRWSNTHEGCTSHDEIIAYNDLAYVHAGEDQVVYESFTTLVGNRPGSGEGKWVLLGGSGTFRDAHHHESEVTALAPGINTFRWTIDNNGCTARDEIVVTYYEMPDVNIGLDTTRGCPPLTVQFVNNSIAGNAKFTWDFGDGNTSVNEKPQYTYYESGEYQVQLKTTGPDGSIVYDDTTITVYDLPVADFDVAPEKVFIPEQILHCYDLSLNADRYLWEFGDDSVSTLRNPAHMYLDKGNYDVCLHVWSDKGCYDSLSLKGGIEVEESGKILFPDAFTPSLAGPNGGHYPENDYENDVFHPLADGVEAYHLEIFNRWGILVFESHDVNLGWDGYYKGELVEEDVYIYRVYGTYNNGRKFEQAGDIMLIRK